MMKKTDKLIGLFLATVMIVTSALPVYGVEESNNDVSILQADEWERVDEDTLGNWDWSREDIQGQSGKKYILLKKYNGSASKLIIPATVKENGTEYPIWLENPNTGKSFFGGNVKELRILGATSYGVGDVLRDSGLSEVVIEGSTISYPGIGGDQSIKNIVLKDCKIENEDLNGIFSYCPELLSVTFDNVTLADKNVDVNFECVFMESVNLKEVTFIGTDTGNVDDYAQMFARCHSLERIYADDKFTVKAGADVGLVFDECRKITGGQGTKYDGSKIDGEYFRIDDKNNGNPGYLTSVYSYLDQNYFKIPNSYSGFGYDVNTGYHIPESIYRAVFGRRGSYVYEMFDDPWGGSCYGLSATSGLFKVSNNGVDTISYNGYGTGMDDFIINDGNHPLDTDYSDDRDEEVNSDLRKFMEAMQISQYDERIQACFVLNTDLDDAVNVIKEEGKIGRPVLVGIFGEEGGHAVLAYGITDDGKGIEIYDSNHPRERRTIALTKEG
ncbi:MAG: hypothetical protein IJT63_06655, partial [Lachnospiraceae bacterium]|nr:hypothetical protein [Lachnospiraceae bacterium]